MNTETIVSHYFEKEHVYLSVSLKDPKDAARVREFLQNMANQIVDKYFNNKKETNEKD